MIMAFMDAPLVAPGSGKISSNIVTAVERLLKKHMQKNTKIHTHTHLHTKTRNGTNIIEEFVRVA